MAQANQDGNMMEHDDSFEDILINFGITNRAIVHLTEDYGTANDLLASDVKQIKSLVNIQNKMNRMHTTTAQRCYINTAQLNHILALYKWTVFAILRMHMHFS